MNHKRGRRSTRRDIEELQAKIHKARVEREALSPEERTKAGQRDWHSTPGPRKEQSPGPPFAAWAALPSR